VEAATRPGMALPVTPRGNAILVDWPLEGRTDRHSAHRALEGRLYWRTYLCQRKIVAWASGRAGFRKANDNPLQENPPWDMPTGVGTNKGDS
jgi:hypothetical protein